MAQIIFLWLVLISINLLIRPLMPIDETRYVSVAWEMWQRGDFLVPYLNGETYSHKPPLLFWLIQLSWSIFGVNDWTPRLISPLFALGSTLLSSLVARELWQERPQVAQFAPLILMGSFFWLIFSTLTMFDMLLAFFVLLAIYSLVKLSTSASWRDLFLLGLAIGGGILSKGPVVLLQILPVALLAPWWMTPTSLLFYWRSWYLNIFYAVLIGMMLALTWAIPAGISGGEAYQNAIFFGQTSGRLVNSFAHQLPWYWYLERLPLLLLPWIFLKPLWQGMQRLSLQDNGVRFCIAWLLPVFMAFSWVSGKRIHYLLPLLPALALLLARSASEITENTTWKKAFFKLWFLFAVIALLLGLVPFLNAIFYWREDLIGISPLWGGVLGSILFVPFFLKCRDINHFFIYVCVFSIATSTLIITGYLSKNADRFDTQPIAQKIAQFRSENKNVAFYTGKYHAQFQFTGRLTEPLTLLSSHDALQDWARQNVEGFILLDSEKLSRNTLFYSHVYRAGELGFIRSQTILEQPNLIE